jgi:hypothetical protein
MAKSVCLPSVADVHQHNRYPRQDRVGLYMWYNVTTAGSKGTGLHQVEHSLHGLTEGLVCLLELSCTKKAASLNLQSHLTDKAQQLNRAVQAGTSFLRLAVTLQQHVWTTFMDCHTGLETPCQRHLYNVMGLEITTIHGRSVLHLHTWPHSLNVRQGALAPSKLSAQP